MKPIAIVYTSNTGYTERYAKMLGAKAGLPVYHLKEMKKLKKGTPIIYLGWLMAGMIKGYSKIKKHCHVCALIGVGLGDTGSQIENVKKANKLSESLPFFTVQGGMNHKKLRGIYKSMIGVLTKVMAGKKQRSADEDAMLALLQKGGDYVSEKNLEAAMKEMQAYEEIL